jgi:uncharacterized protein (TIGR02145 family)
MKIFWMLFVALVFISCLQSQPDSGSQSPAEIQSIQFNYLGKTAQITGDADSLYLKVQQQSQTLLESGYSFSDATFKEDLIIKAQIPVQIQAQVFDELGELLWQADTSLLAQPDASIKLVLNLHAVSLGSSSSGVSSSSIASSSPSVWCDTPGNCGAFTDARDSKVYNWTKIGDQVWMAENLNYTPTSGNSWCYDNIESNCNTYGRLYDWNTALTVCPTGWHLPTSAEWGTLETTVDGASTAGTKLKSETGWTGGGVVGTNDYGFSALPGGHYLGGSFYNVGYLGRWWTATENDATDAYGRNVDYNTAYVNSYPNSKTNGYSVRCLQDTPIPISSSSSVTPSSSSSVALSSSIAPSSSSVVMPSSSSNSLAWCDTPGNCGNFTDARDSKVYNWTKIGTQTWMAENLNFGAWILGSGYQTNDAEIEKYCFDDNETNCDIYGGLYQWSEAMELPYSCNTSDAGLGLCIVATTHQGICPENWHIPTRTEWATLEAWVDSANGGSSNDEGASLKSTNLWNDTGAGTDIYGWTGLPSGSFNSMTFNNQGVISFWWSATQSSSTNAYSLGLNYSHNYLSESGSVKYGGGYSVRCIQD